MDVQDVGQTVMKGSLLFLGGYFIYRSVNRLLHQTSSTELKSQVCTVSMGCLGTTLASAALTL